MSNVISMYTGEPLLADPQYEMEQRVSRAMIELLLDLGYDITDYIIEHYDK